MAPPTFVGVLSAYSASTRPPDTGQARSLPRGACVPWGSPVALDQVTANERLNTTEVYPLTTPEARSPMSWCLQGFAPTKGSGAGGVLASPSSWARGCLCLHVALSSSGCLF